MFKLDFFCEDKNLSRLMHILNGIALNLSVVPVANAAGKNGAVVAKTSGDPVEMLLQYMKENKMKTINARQAQDAMVAMGRKPGGYSAVLTKAVQAKVIKKTGNGHSTTYQLATSGSK